MPTIESVPLPPPSLGTVSLQAPVVAPVEPPVIEAPSEVRPLAPVLSEAPIAPPQPQVAAPRDQAFTVTNDEDDDVIADLAAAIDVGGMSPINIPAPSSTSAARRRGRTREAILASLFVRRTLIPIMLTLGILLPVLGAAWFVMPVESPFKAVGQELPWAMLLIGPVFLVVGILNMLQVRAALRGH
jgi:hypothetical protein